MKVTGNLYIRAETDEEVYFIYQQRENLATDKGLNLLQASNFKSPRNPFFTISFQHP